MIPELGNVALILALGLALVLGSLPLVGAATGHVPWMRLARRVAIGQCVLVTLAFAVLVYSFVVNDFSVSYVAAHSNSKLPVHFRAAATWGGHEGSILLWIQLLAFWSAAVAVFSRALPLATVVRVLGVMGLLSVGFLLFLLLTSNPFARTLPAAPDGRDLNPLLQDLGMIAHPPVLYMGYVGFSVVFAFAIAALLEGRLDAAWARWCRPWTLLAWAFLTLGIALGSAWAYYVLGWGGWWFWDAVENASFMPWLVGTALLHSLAVTEKRAGFKNWTILLAIIAFSLSLLGTFLVRSGVLTSVHAFASDPKRGVYILLFLAVVVGGALALYAWRAPRLGLGAGRFALFSREALLLVNNLLLMTAAGTVLLGTLYPLLLDALGLGKISVGPPYFDAVFVPLMLPLLLLMAVGPLLPWQRAALRDVARLVRWVAAGAVVFAAAVALTLHTSAGVAVGLGLAVWIALSTVSALVRRLLAPPSGTFWVRRFTAIPGSYWGMTLAHAGVAVFVIGVTLVKGLESESDHHLRVGDSARLGVYEFTFTGLNKVQGPNYVAARGQFDVRHDNGGTLVLYPEKRFYTVSQMPMTEAAIDRGFTRDLYVSLAEATEAGSWVVRLQHKPFMNWVWAGALAIALGGLLAALDRRYRRAPRSASQPTAAGTSPIAPLPSPV
ncbi:MAG: heme lyase CcmF/NrfE family subunit [Pseudomonadota bacterium]